MSPSYKRLHGAAEGFCTAFAQKKDIETLLTFFSTSHNPSAIEHGEPSLAPFLGIAFAGKAGIQKYFDLVSAVLLYDNVEFCEYVVDTETSRVSVKGTGKFTWVDTGESWNETFAYMLDFDDELKITDYQVWADSGAAYLARVGQLADVKKLNRKESNSSVGGEQNN